MKRARKTNRVSSRAIVETLHFRLCHVCYFLNEAENEISECTKCHNTFVPEEEWDEDVMLSSMEMVEDHEDEADIMGMSWARRKSTGLQGLMALF